MSELMTTKDFAQHLRQDQRLVMLRILSEMPSYRANSSDRKSTRLNSSH